MLRCFHYLLLLSFLGCPISVVYAQEKPLLFEHYDSEKGLSQNSGYALAQDRQGFLWVGTQDGLNRFDGIGFKVYRRNDNDSGSIPFNEISALMADSAGNLLAGSPQGLAVYRAKTDRFCGISEYLHIAPTFDSLSVNKLFGDNQNNIWILTRYNGICRINTASGNVSEYFTGKETRNTITGITQDQRGQIWVSTNNSLYRFDGTAFNIVDLSNIATWHRDVLITDISFLDEKLWIGTLGDGIFVLGHPDTEKNVVHLKAGETPYNLTSNDIKCLLPDRRHQMWIGTRNGGLCVYDARSGKIRKARNSFYVENSIRKDFVLSLFEDHQGILWAGLSGGGLAKYDSHKFQFNTYRQHPGKSDALADNMIFCIAGKDRDELLVGTQNGGISLFNTSGKYFRSFSRIPGITNTLPSNTVYGIGKENENTFWIATWGGLTKMQFNRSAMPAFTVFNNGPATLHLYSLAKLPGSPRLLISGTDGLFCFNTRTTQWEKIHDITGFTADRTIVGRYILPVSDTSVWIATEGLGLVHYDPRKGEIRQLPGIHAISENVRYVLPDKNNLWLGTDDGLILYDTKLEKVNGVWTTRNGLPNNVIYAIVRDLAGNLWLSSNNGLSRFNPGRNTFNNYDAGYGLQGMEFNTASCYAGANGLLYFGGVNGFSEFNPAHIAPNIYTPDVKITAIRLFDKEVTDSISPEFTTQLRLRHDQNFITIEFTALNFSHPEKNQYAYMLEGVDESWINAGKKNFASYTKLSPGTYVFKVKASNSDGKWSDEVTTLQLLIKPPFWQTAPFQVAMAIVLTALAAWLWTNKVRNVRKEERIKSELNTKIASAETAALRAQMNPHFIFNTLNSINSYIIDNNARVASEYLTKFARLIRIILENSRNEFISLGRELETLRLYLMMESIRFNNKFDYEIVVGENVDTENILVPPMIIQPYVENAIWHGLLQKKEKGKAIITIGKTDNHTIEVKIIDNGIGRQKAMELKSKESTMNKSYGVKITNDRLTMNNERNRVEIVDMVDKEGNASGTTVILQLTV